MKSELYPDPEMAYIHFASLLHKYLPVINVREQHRGLHRMIETENIDFYCVFKRNLFISFNQQFPEFVLLNPEYRGVAETLNEEALKMLISRAKKSLLVFLYENKNPNKKAGKYVVNPNLFYKFAVHNDLIRVQDAVNVKNRADFSGEREYIHEKTMHLPFQECFFHNFEEWIEKQIRMKPELMGL